MNNDLISRAALLSDLNELYMAALRKDVVSVESIYELDHLSMLVKDAPAVDAEPVRHGRWIPMYEEIEMLTTEGWIMRETQTAWKCSECGREEEIARDTMLYCHCGAKMDEEVTNG